MTRFYIDKVEMLCFDKGNDGLGITYSYGNDLEVEDLSDELILKKLAEVGVVFNAPRVLICEYFTKLHGRESYERELHQYLEDKHFNLANEDEIFEPDVDQYVILITHEMLLDYNLPILGKNQSTISTEKSNEA